MLNNMVISGSVNGAPTLLWTNDAPSSNFSAQTISLPTGYKAYLVEMRLQGSLSDQMKGIAYVPFGSDFPCAAFWVHTSNLQYISPNTTKYRYINSAYSGGINFGSGTPSNANAIPLRIWGLPYSI